MQSTCHTFSTKHITELEAVQKKMQSMIREMENLLYGEKLKGYKKFTLQEMNKRGYNRYVKCYQYYRQDSYLFSYPAI